MRCKVIQRKFDLYLAEGLAATERKQIEAHLHSCPDCRAELARQEQLLALLKGDWPIPPVPDGFSIRLMNKARQRLTAQQPSEMSVPWGLRRWWTSISLPMRAEVAATLAAGLLIGVFLGQQTWQSAHRPTPRQAAQNDPLEFYTINYLTDAPGDSLAGTYLALMGSPQR